MASLADYLNLTPQKASAKFDAFGNGAPSRAVYRQVDFVSIETASRASWACVSRIP